VDEIEGLSRHLLHARLGCIVRSFSPSRDRIIANPRSLFLPRYLNEMEIENFPDYLPSLVKLSYIRISAQNFTFANFTKFCGMPSLRYLYDLIGQFQLLCSG